MLPVTAAGWWRRTTAAPAVEQWLVLGGLPALLTLLWLGGVSSRFEFSLAAESVFESERTLLTAFTANYVHVGARHLFDNLLNFWVTLFAVYPLVAVAGWQRQFRLSLMAYLCLVPFGIAWLTLGTLGTVTNQPSVGFSGIVAALLGFLPVVLCAAAATVTDGEVTPAWSAVPFLGSLGLVFAAPSVSYFPVNLPLAAGCLAAAIVSGGLLWWLDRPLQFPSSPSRLSADSRLAFLIGITVFGFGVSGALLFVRPGTNVWGHLAGYVSGFLIPYLAFVITPMLTASRR